MTVLLSGIPETVSLRKKACRRRRLTLSNKEIREVGSVEFTVSDVRDKGYSATNPVTGEEYRRIDYEILMTFHNPRSTFEMIIPRGGKFPGEDTWGEGDVSNETRWGENYFLFQGVVHCAAAVFSTRPAPTSDPEGPRRKAVSGKTSERRPTSLRRSRRLKKAKRVRSRVLTEEK